MGIVNYQHIAEVAEKKLFSNKKISTKNKNCLKDFLLAYDVSFARRAIFIKHIEKLLEATDDIKVDMNNYKGINSIFNQLRQTFSPAYYSTIVSCSVRFVRWLNEGEKPKGFKDIKNIAKSKQKRDLKPSDMITWEEGLEMIKVSPSIQYKAIVGVILSSGMRPGEFIDLKYGDIEQKRNYMIAHVKGKTGSRAVIIDKGSPYLSQWLSEHPTKKRSDYLWVMEAPTNSHKNRYHGETKYTYEAIVKRVKKIGEWAGVNKPLDFYNFRHSCAVLMAKWNIPVEVRAKNMGHSVKMHIDTYGRLNVDDDLDRFDRANGITKEEEEAKANHKCKVCSTINEPDLTHCKKCNSPLSLEIALKEESVNKEQMDAVNEQMKLMQEQMKQMQEQLRKQVASQKNFNVADNKESAKQLWDTL